MQSSTAPISRCLMLPPPIQVRSVTAPRLFFRGLTVPIHFSKTFGISTISAADTMVKASVTILPMADKDHLILTATGPDRMGLVEQISAFISERGCNIEDSKMAVFCGEFAVIILISGEREDLARITFEYREIESKTGLTVAVKSPSAKKTLQSFIPYKLTA